jgi:two-component system, cell cycle response regulator DivK
MKKVLYVEDDSINAFVILKLLASDFHVAHVPDGETCLTLLQEEKFDCILMDINLGKGKMDGIEAMKKIRELTSYKKIPVFALTSYAMPEDEERFLNDGFDFYLSKPIERRVLIQHINKFIG